MPLPYNTTTIENTTNLFDFFVEINVLSSGWFAYLLLVALFLIMLSMWMHRGFKAAAIGSSFVTTIIAVMLWSVGMISASIVVFPIIMLLIFVFIQLFSEG